MWDVLLHPDHLHRLAVPCQDFSFPWIAEAVGELIINFVLFKFLKVDDSSHHAIPSQAFEALAEAQLSIDGKANHREPSPSGGRADQTKHHHECL